MCRFSSESGKYKLSYSEQRRESVRNSTRGASSLMEMTLHTQFLGTTFAGFAYGRD